ncbi:MAG: OsmC family protein [Planctomycetes bacterium]|nr:OsmC family protein [Planctomycetota bacterium]
MTQPFPHRYEATLSWEGGSRAALSSGSRPVLVGGPPPEFDGEPGWWSPEHLLLSAANLCLMTTYQALAKKAGLEIGGYRSRADGLLEKTREGIRFTRITLRIAIFAPASRLDEARRLIETAKKYCIVSNALKTPVEVEATVDPVEGLARAS